MPNSTIHLACALHALDGWSRSGSAPGFQPDNRRAAQLLLYGAVAPDLGFFPRTDRRFSDLAHQSGTAELARALLRHAATEEQRAYAAGWVAHMIADIRMHPAINRAVAAALAAHPAAHPPARETLILHMGIEYGLDHLFFPREPRLATLQLGPPPTAAELAHVTAAFAEVHGIRIDPARLERDHVILRRVVHLGLLLNRGFTASWRRSPAHAGLRTLLGGIAPLALRWPASVETNATLRSVLRPITPPPELVLEIGRQMAAFPQLLHDQLASGLARMPDLDLFTGLPHGSRQVGHTS